MPNSFNAWVQESIQKYWDLPALSDYGVQTFQYKDVARIIEKLHITFEASGLKPGDRVAICGRNSARWGIVFFATLTYGAVAVPILHEFLPEQIHDIVNHSEAKLLFVGDQVWPKLDPDKMPRLEGIIGNSNDEYRLFVGRTEQVRYARENLNKLFGEKYPKNFRPQHLNYHMENPDDLAVLNYTSGTTSNSKGVMIPYRAIWSNTKFAVERIGIYLKPGDKTISMLPMAHMYGMAFEFIFEFLIGVHVNFLAKTPTPSVLLTTFSEVRPRLIIAVPLIIEKIVRKAVLPKLQTPALRIALHTPLLRDRVKAEICRKLQDAFGGNFYEIIVGGASFSQEIESVLKDINFKYTVGYGTTECAPLLAYEDWEHFAKGSCGKAVDRMELKIDSPDPKNIPGEILARGMNVMLGYYKNQEATDETLRDGWYHTGDLAVIDDEGNIFIKGRSKNMLLGANGQNIYPEEIEDKLASLPYVTECVVIQKENNLYGLVYSDPEEVKLGGLTEAMLEAQMEKNRQDLNQVIPSYARIHGIRLVPEEFEKTPKRSIKRYKYKSYPV
ncbi:MAG: AMP-binding protein [Bacteroidaceae bacterium]|nr:AMP-binding protein [Bacteroidaceae bacterium]